MQKQQEAVWGGCPEPAPHHEESPRISQPLPGSNGRGPFPQSVMRDHRLAVPRLEQGRLAPPEAGSHRSIRPTGP